MYSISAGSELLYSDVHPSQSRKVTSPTLKMAVDEAGSLEFTMSKTNKCYTAIERMKTIITVKKYDVPIWDGRVIEEYRDFNNNKKMYVEGALAFLNDTTQPIKEYKNVSFEDLITAVLSTHNTLVDTPRQIFWGGIADSFNPEDLEYWATAYESTITAIKNIADYFGCHYIVQKDPYTGLNNLVFFSGVIKNSNQTIMFGENLLDYTENYDLSKLATVLLPLSRTDRESADIPRGPGTDIDLSHVQPYDDSKHYGVIMAKTEGYVCRKFLHSTGYVNVPVPPYRNKLNLVAKEVDGNYEVERPDTIAFNGNGYEWTIPNYVQIWIVPLQYIHGGYDNWTLDEAMDAKIDPLPITNRSTNFSFVLDYTPIVHAGTEYPWEYTIAYYNPYGEGYRSYQDRSRIVIENLVEDYGIITPHKDTYCAVIELDYEHFKTLYLTASTWGSGWSEQYRSVSVWKKSKDFDESTTFVPKQIEKRRYIFNGGGYLPEWEGEGLTYYPAFIYSVGYTLDPNADPSNSTFDDLIPGDIPMIMNLDKYTFVQEFELDPSFERRVDLNPALDPETDSMRILVVISGSRGPFGVTLVSREDELVDSTVTIGMDQNGIDLSKTHYIRYYTDRNTWRPPNPGEECDPDGHWNANDIYDENNGYGVLVPLTEGKRIVTLSELEEIGNPSFNVFNNGTFNTETASNGIVISNELDTNYKCCVFVTKASYEDPATGRKYPNSIYISSKMKGKSGLYAIFEFTDGNGNNGVWDVNSGDKPQNLRQLKEPIEFGKYINGFTTLDGKKVTMPYASDPNRLMFVVIGSYEDTPRVWIHDPKQAEQMQYLTISAVNNGSEKLIADASNRFTSSLEYGNIDDQNGSVLNGLTYERLRTREPIAIPADGSYMLVFESSDPDAIVSANVYMYGKIDGYLGNTGFHRITAEDPYILLPYLYEGYSVNVVFKKRYQDSESDEEMNTNDIMYPMLWREERSTTMLFTQGSLSAVTDLSGYVELVSDDTVTNVISTADYYTTTDNVCTLKVAINIDSINLPITVDVDGRAYPIKSRIIWMSYLEQSPEIETDQATTERRVVYKSYYDPGDVHMGPTFKIQSTNNTRYKFFVTCDVTYYDDNDEEQTVYDVDILPSHVRTFSVVPYTDDHKQYIPPNNSYEKYGHIEKRIEFDNVNSSEELKERAEMYMNQSQFDEVTLKVKALDMTAYNPSFDNNLDVADSVRVISPPHGLYRDFPITELSIPFDNIQNTTYDMGYDNKDTLANLIQGG